MVQHQQQIPLAIRIETVIKTARSITQLIQMVLQKKMALTQLNLYPVRLILQRNWKMQQILIKNLTLQLPEQM